MKTPLPPRPCAQCGAEFPPSKHNQRFCALRCSQVWHAADYKRRLQEAKAAPPGPKPLPWATPEVCAAVRLGIKTPSAQKLGRFALVQDYAGTNSRVLVHVPTEKLSFPPERIVLIATLNERRRWLLQPAAREARP